MPTTYTHYANPYGGASGQKRVYDAPEEGEIFTNIRSGDSYTIFQYKNGKVVTLTPTSFTASKNTGNIAQYNAAILADLGIDDIKNLPIYNQADAGFWGETHDPNRAANLWGGELSTDDVIATGYEPPTEEAATYHTGMTATDISDEEAAAQGAERVSDVAPGTAPKGQPAGGQGFAEPPGGATATQPPTSTTGWVDPATGNETPEGTGVPAGEYQPPAGEIPAQGTIPGYQGVYEGQEDLMANPEAVIALFSAYHGRDATQEELDYWTQKKVGNLEDTLAKTEFFDGPDADAIRAQMMAQGLDYIPNQAQLESLMTSGGLDPATIEQYSGQTGMMFAPETAGPVPGTTGTEGVITGEAPAGETPTGDTAGTGDPSDDIINQVVDAVGDVGASDIDILNALNEIKEGQIDPYYQQLIGQIQQDVVGSINRTYEDRIRELQSESFQLSENIRGAQGALESQGMTFSGEAIRQIGTLSAFGQGTPEGLTPAQLGQEGEQVMGGQPLRMTPEQMGLEGNVNMQNRLMAEASRTRFNRGLEDIGTSALRTLGSAGIAGMGLPAQALANYSPTTGTMQYGYSGTLQDLYGNLANQEGTLTDYQQGFL